MTCFYRLMTVGDPDGKATGIKFLRAFRPSGKTGMLPVTWWRGMEEIPLSPPWPHCKVVRMPVMPEGFDQEQFVFRLRDGVALPDVIPTSEFLVVSSRAKLILERCDDFEHQYIQTELWREDERPCHSIPYYLLNVRRVLKIDNLGGEIKRWPSFFDPTVKEEDFFPALQQVPGLTERVAQIPLWRHYYQSSVVYLSASTLNALRDAGVTGLKDHTGRFGKPGETVTRFELV